MNDIRRIELITSPLSNCVRLVCGYCKVSVKETGLCAAHDPVESIHAMLAHMIADHWDEVINMKNLYNDILKRR